MASILSIIKRFVAPALPKPQQEYDQKYFDNLVNILRLYFNELDQFLGNVAGKSNEKITLPYGAFSSYTSQALTVPDTATQLTLSNTDFSSDVSIVSSAITVTYPGIYNLQFSVQIQNLANAPVDAFIWLKQNGVDISGSTGKIGLPARKNPGDPFHDIKGWNYFLSMNAGDSVEMYWSTPDILVTIETYAASGTPTKPSTASVVATLTFVSAII